MKARLPQEARLAVRPSLPSPPGGRSPILAGRKVVKSTWLALRCGPMLGIRTGAAEDRVKADGQSPAQGVRHRGQKDARPMSHGVESSVTQKCRPHWPSPGSLPYTLVNPLVLTCRSRGREARGVTPQRTGGFLARRQPSPPSTGPRRRQRISPSGLVMGWSTQLSSNRWWTGSKATDERA